MTVDESRVLPFNLSKCVCGSKAVLTVEVVDNRCTAVVRCWQLECRIARVSVTGSVQVARDSSDLAMAGAVIWNLKTATERTRRLFGDHHGA